MKPKRLLSILAFSTILFSFAACGDAEVCTHTDDNYDGICDSCNEIIRNQSCAECKDDNSDGKCDICGSTVERETCGECIDTDGDGYCDVCDEEIKTSAAPIELISKGKHNFSFVLSKDLPYTAIKEIDSIITKLKKLGYEVNKLTDTADNVSEESHTEILVGKITSREEEYRFNEKTLGPEGYTVQIKNNNVIISGGSDESTVTAIRYFKERVLGLSNDTKRLTNVTFKSDDVITERQTEFPITSVKIGDRLINDYAIVYDSKSPESYNLAKKLQESLYTYAGLWLEAKNASSAPSDKYIAITAAEKSGGLGFEIKIDRDNITVRSEFPNKTLEVGSNYITSQIESKTGDISLTEITENVRDVNYEMFGAYGDGDKAHNDYQAIKSTHEYANKHGHNVVVTPGKSYYIGADIGSSANYITVRTNVDWGNARFIIDDSEIPLDGIARDLPVFIVENDTSYKKLEASSSEIIQSINENGGIKASEFTKLDLGIGRPLLLVLVNANHKNYIVYGTNANSGTSQTEIILVDAEGNVSADTPLLFDYEQITEIKVYAADTPSITVNGGIFTTIANKAPTQASRTHPYNRGIRITRSNTVVQNITHYVEGEGEQGEGMPYECFLGVNYAYNVLFSNCTYTARKTYFKLGTNVGMGSYDISAGASTHVIWRNCNQTNFFGADGFTPTNDGNLWGIMGSSLCKNLTFDSCILSRFDAHAGVYNTTIKDSSLQMFRIVGGGSLVFDNVHMYSRTNSLISLREDYGSFWHGKITIKDVTMHNSGKVTLIGGKWYNHYFGYDTEMPTEIEIDGLTLTNPAEVNIFSNEILTTMESSLSDTVNGTQNVNRIKPTERVTIKNNRNGYTFVIPNKEIYTFFKNTVFEITDEE